MKASLLIKYLFILLINLFLITDIWSITKLILQGVTLGQSDDGPIPEYLTMGHDTMLGVSLLMGLTTLTMIRKGNGFDFILFLTASALFLWSAYASNIIIYPLVTLVATLLVGYVIYSLYSDLIKRKTTLANNT